MRHIHLCSSTGLTALLFTGCHGESAFQSSIDDAFFSVQQLHARRWLKWLCSAVLVYHLRLRCWTQSLLNPCLKQAPGHRALAAREQLHHVYKHTEQAECSALNVSHTCVVRDIVTTFTFYHFTICDPVTCTTKDTQCGTQIHTVLMELQQILQGDFKDGCIIL